MSETFYNNLTFVRNVVASLAQNQTFDILEGTFFDCSKMNNVKKSEYRVQTHKNA